MEKHSLSPTIVDNQNLLRLLRSVRTEIACEMGRFIIKEFYLTGKPLTLTKCQTIFNLTRQNLRETNVQSFVHFRIVLIIESEEARSWLVVEEI